jgi:hypothetical protein
MINDKKETVVIPSHKNLSYRYRYILCFRAAPPIPGIWASKRQTLHPRWLASSFSWLIYKHEIRTIKDERLLMSIHSNQIYDIDQSIAGVKL